MNTSRKDWLVKLDDTLWAYRTAYKSPIYRNVFGKPCHLPLELEYKAMWQLRSQILIAKLLRRKYYSS